MSTATLRDENERLKALLAQAALSEHQAALATSEEARRRLEVILGEVRREKFGAKSEKLRPDQYHLPREDVEIAQGVLDAAQERAAAVIRGRSRASKARTKVPGSPLRDLASVKSGRQMPTLLSFTFLDLKCGSASSRAAPPV
ncbi:transposase [Bradyrhizobium pachyrhizi]|uniref:transposase n=1 Tax=Bradyrhizobium pachyrhizi TaxID=280333 RepID=UPI001FCCD01E|nr:transposase [Bradyrhizobium pachyrhizi]